MVPVVTIPKYVMYCLVWLPYSFFQEAKNDFILGFAVRDITNYCKLQPETPLNLPIGFLTTENQAAAW